MNYLVKGTKREVFLFNQLCVTVNFVTALLSLPKVCSR